MTKFYGRKFSIFLLLLIVGALGFYSPFIRTFFVTFSTTIQSFYLDTKEKIEEVTARHFLQSQTIERLRQQVHQLEQEMLTCRYDAHKYHTVIKALGLEHDNHANFIPVASQGYAFLGNFQQVWLKSFADYNASKNYGVIRNGYAIGVVVAQNSRPLMILAGDPACNFAVYIGENRAPGIAKGLDARHMIVQYIPEWMKLKIGDKVFTSGLDQIFPLGVPVGRVLSLEKMQGFKNAKIELFGDTLHPDYVWVVDRQ
jgi:rod shape-determining protein MreC